MKSIEKELLDNNYKTVYDELRRKKYEITFESISKDFPKVSGMQKFCFLMYALSKEERPEIYMTICEILMFETFFCDIFPLIYWYTKRCVTLFPRFVPIQSLMVDMYYQCPDCPFSDEELRFFAQSILTVDPADTRAKEILGV